MGAKARSSFVASEATRVKCRMPMTIIMQIEIRSSVFLCGEGVCVCERVCICDVGVHASGLCVTCACDMCVYVCVCACDMCVYVCICVYMCVYVRVYTKRRTNGRHDAHKTWVQGARQCVQVCRL